MAREYIIDLYEESKELFEIYAKENKSADSKRSYYYDWKDVLYRIGEELDGKALLLDNGKILIHNDERNELYEIELCE